MMKPETPHEMGLGMSFTLSIHMASFQDKSPRFVPKVCYSPYSALQSLPRPFRLAIRFMSQVTLPDCWNASHGGQVSRAGRAGTTGTRYSLLVHCGDCFDNASITVSDCFRSFFFYFQSLDCKMLIGSLASLDARGCWQFCGENPEAYVNVVNAEILMKEPLDI